MKEDKYLTAGPVVNFIRCLYFAFKDWYDLQCLKRTLRREERDRR